MLPLDALCVSQSDEFSYLDRNGYLELATVSAGVVHLTPAMRAPQLLVEAMRAANNFHHSDGGRRVWIRWIQRLGHLHWARFRTLPGMPDLRSASEATRLFDLMQGDVRGTKFEFFLEKFEQREGEIVWSDGHPAGLCMRMQRMAAERRCGCSHAAHVIPPCVCRGLTHRSAPRTRAAQSQHTSCLSWSWIDRLRRLENEGLLTPAEADRQFLMLFAAILHEAAHAMLVYVLTTATRCSATELFQMLGGDAFRAPPRPLTDAERAAVEAADAPFRRLDALRLRVDSGDLLELELFGALLTSDASRTVPFRILHLYASRPLLDQSHLYDGVAHNARPAQVAVPKRWSKQLVASLRSDRADQKAYCADDQHFRLPAEILTFLDAEEKSANIAMAREIITEHLQRSDSASSAASSSSSGSGSQPPEFVGGLPSHAFVSREVDAHLLTGCRGR